MRFDRFSRDVLWNVASIGVAGASALAVNILIGFVYGASALGAFNQVFALFLVFAQLGTLGVHGSLLAYASPEDRPSEQHAIATAGLVLGLGSAIAMAAVMLAVAGPVGRLVDSADVAAGMPWAAPAVACLALDKLALAVLNARRRMRWYATVQAARAVFMAVGFGACVAIDVAPARLPVVLTIGEGSALVIALAGIRDQLAWPAAGFAGWLGRHARFGARGLLSGLFAELNMRIVVLILGLFASDAAVGAYSFAALIAEGMYQVLIALRTNYAPLAVRQLAAGQRDALLAMIARGRRRVYGASLPIAAVVVAAVALVVPRTVHDPALADSWIYFAIVVAGMVASAGYVPFNQLPLWAGRPGLHTWQIAVTVGGGIAIAVALIATEGPLGAAIATAATHVWGMVVLRLLARRLLGLAI